MYIEPFSVEIWMNEWENNCRYNLAETCVESVTIDQLLQLAGRNASDLSEILQMKMTYGDIEGSPRLRQAIAALYETQPVDDIVVTHGTIAANMLVHKTLVSRGDHVIAIVPTYQQHYSIPASIGAEVETLSLQAKDGFLPDLDALRAMMRPDTRMIALTNPNNPTGALMGRDMLQQIAEIARPSGAYVLCDEVYRGTEQSSDTMTPAMADIYERGISTAGMSKAYSLAGLRLGWVAAPAEIKHDLLVHRDYDTISVGKVNDHLAAIALEAKDALLGRSRAITRTNLAILESWIADQPRVSWIKPQAGTTAMLKIDLPDTSRAFCLDLLDKTGVMLMPGDAFDMEGHVRIGYANPTQDLRDGLAALSDYLSADGG